MDIISWLSTIFGDFPQLSWFKYVVAAVFIMVVFDAAISILFRALDGLAGGGRR